MPSVPQLWGYENRRHPHAELARAYMPLPGVRAHLDATAKAADVAATPRGPHYARPLAPRSKMTSIWSPAALRFSVRALEFARRGEKNDPAHPTIPRFVLFLNSMCSSRQCSFPRR